jgi:microcystin degradation protein MlrC
MAAHAVKVMRGVRLLRRSIAGTGFMKVGIISIKHESSTFNPAPTTLVDFKNEVFLMGENIRRKYSSAHHEVTGFLQGLETAGIEAVPLVMFGAGPSGVITNETWDALWRLATVQLDSAGPLDAILAAPHGAAVGEGARLDLDGWWLGELRRRVGPRAPIVATLDPHGNLSETMVAACDAIVSYRENPHIDQRQRGLEAAEILVQTLQGKAKPTMKASFPPVAINIEAQGTREEPMLAVIRELDRIRGQPGILSASILMGFPYADVPEMGASFIVVAENDPKRAEALAGELAEWLVKNRELYKGNLIAPDEALRRALTARRPVGLLDMGDNMGGGSPADSTVLAHLCHRMATLRVFVCLADPESEQQARRSGVGARLRMKMGGKSPVSPAAPLEAEVEVRSLHAGNYRELEARHGGQTDFDMGPTTVVATNTGLTIMLTNRRAFPGSLGQLTSCGLKPEDFDLIIIKGVHAPVAAYAPMCGTLIRVNTPGTTTADMVKLLTAYQRRRKPLYPFEAEI